MLSYVGPKGLVAAGAASRLWYDVTSRDKLYAPFVWCVRVRVRCAVMSEG